MARQLCEDKSAGLCYSDVSSGNPTTMQNHHHYHHHHLVNQIQGFVSDPDDPDPDMFNLTSGMEMIGFSKNLHHQQQQSDTTNALMWKSLLGKHGQHPAGPSSSKTMEDSSSTTFYHHETSCSDNIIVGAHHDSSGAPWQENSRLVVADDSSSLRCVFPCEGNERPSQGLSLSLSSTNPSTIGLQSFELRHTSHNLHHQNHQTHNNLLQEGFFGKSANAQHVLHDGYLSAAKASTSSSTSLCQGHFLLNNKYLVPAQELLYEFCSLGTKQSDASKQKSHNKNKQWEEDNSSGSSKKHSLTSLEFVELQKRKTKLLCILEEVERRYKHYRNQMKAVVSSFEAVAGEGAATVYSALALKAMSRYFRRLKDGILGQIQATRKAMGEKDPVAPGTTRGETPRLKIIDQSLRQQRAFQQMSMMETHPWRPQRGLPERSVSVLRAWLFEHFLHPYPSDVDKHILARQTGLSRSQVSNWFINARVRLWKPMVEEMYLEEVKEGENNMVSSEGGTDPDEDHNNDNTAAPSSHSEDKKPTPDGLVGLDSECQCASSILTNHTQFGKKNDPNNSTTSSNRSFQEQCLGRVTDTFGAVELDFSTYTHHSSGMISYGTSNDDHNNGKQQQQQGGVSLTLGLQQHGHGVSLAFPPSNDQSSLFYPPTTAREHQIDDCQTVNQYSLVLDAEGQNLPYRNLMGMGAHLLHDLAG